MKSKWQIDSNQKIEIKRIQRIKGLTHSNNNIRFCEQQQKTIFKETWKIECFFLQHISLALKLIQIALLLPQKMEWTITSLQQFRGVEWFRFCHCPPRWWRMWRPLWLPWCHSPRTSGGSQRTAPARRWARWRREWPEWWSFLPSGLPSRETRRGAPPRWLQASCRCSESFSPDGPPLLGH